MFLVPVVVIAATLTTTSHELPGPTAIALVLAVHALIFIRQESRLPALKKEQAELERLVAERQQQQDEAKKKKEELITIWLNKEGGNDDSPKDVSSYQ